MKSKAADDVTEVAGRMPLVDMDVTVIKSGKAAAGGKEEDGVLEVKLRRIFKSQEAGGGGRGRDRGGSGGGGGGRAAAPRAVCPLFPKVKEEGWWLVLGERSSRELLALRRVSFGNTSFAKLTYAPPEGVVNPDLVVYLISDCYIGLDQEVEVKGEPVGGDDGLGSCGGEREEEEGAPAVAGGSGTSRFPAPRPQGKDNKWEGNATAQTETEAKVESSDDDSFWVDPAEQTAAADEESSDDEFWLADSGDKAAVTAGDVVVGANDDAAPDSDSSGDDEFWEVPPTHAPATPASGVAPPPTRPLLGGTGGAKGEDPYFWEGEREYLAAEAGTTTGKTTATSPTLASTADEPDFWFDEETMR